MSEVDKLQRELLTLKTEYLSKPTNDKHDEEFAMREAELGARFRSIGAVPSYPAREAGDEV